MNIVEGISGLWHYHLSNSITYALCGAQTMRTSMALDEWGKPFGEHFPKRPTWCKECERLAKEPPA